MAAKTTTAIHTRGRLSNQSLIADPWGVPFVEDASRRHTKLLVANCPHDSDTTNFAGELSSLITPSGARVYYRMCLKSSSCEGPLLAQSGHDDRALRQPSECPFDSRAAGAEAEIVVRVQRRYTGRLMFGQRVASKKRKANPVCRRPRNPDHVTNQSSQTWQARWRDGPHVVQSVP